MGQLGPFWPNSNESKRGQGGISAVPNHKWAHLRQCLTQNPINPKWPKNHLRTQIGHKSVHGLWNPLEATRSAPSKYSPPVQGKNSLSSMHSVLKDQEWRIYSIIYRYTPFFLSNPIVTLSEHNYVIPYQVPSPSPFSKKDFSAIQSGNSLAATRRPFEDPNHLALQRLGCHLLIRTKMRAILTGYQSFQSLSRHQVFSISWTTQLVHTGSNQASCMALAQLGDFMFHCGNKVTQFQFSRWPELY
ncbi:hypothetical protein O181_061696 [Austropuccinia psidii MF-1]|uniref:Uncharacterized protein n=1 Tax=Austropuccinia psidii MF-1 TaxID=1389203 RepID=A0A9Q3HXT2_9BASI|nr:hypothetical protein [Austropuccinia psidii MF-1]